MFPFYICAGIIKFCFFCFKIPRDGRENTNLAYKSVQRSMHRWKNKEHPPIPESIKELRNAFQKAKIKEKYGDSYDADGKFYIDTVLTPNHDFTVFASPFVMKFIEDNIPDTSRSYLMDGTFDKLPKGFYQMLIISIEYQNRVSKFYVYSPIRPARPSTHPSVHSLACPPIHSPARPSVRPSACPRVSPSHQHVFYLSHLLYDLFMIMHPSNISVYKCIHYPIHI